MIKKELNSYSEEILWQKGEFIETENLSETSGIFGEIDSVKKSSRLEGTLVLNHMGKTLSIELDENCFFKEEDSNINTIEEYAEFMLDFCKKFREIRKKKQEFYEK